MPGSRARPISAAGRARAVEIGQRAREAATAALTSVLAPLPHYRGQPSALIASIVVSLGRQLQLPDAEIDRLRVAALLHDVGKVAVPEEILEKPTRPDVIRVADGRPAPAHRPGHPRAGRRPQGRRADHPPPPRALRRSRLPVRAARQRDPARRPDRGHRRRLRRDDQRPPVQAGDHATTRRSPSCAATPGRSSTRARRAVLRPVRRPRPGARCRRSWRCRAADSRPPAAPLVVPDAAATRPDRRAEAARPEPQATASSAMPSHAPMGRAPMAPVGTAIESRRSAPPVAPSHRPAASRRRHPGVPAPSPPATARPPGGLRRGLSPSSRVRGAGRCPRPASADCGEPPVSQRYAAVQPSLLASGLHPPQTQGRDRSIRPTGKEIGP